MNKYIKNIVVINFATVLFAMGAFADHESDHRKKMNDVHHQIHSLARTAKWETRSETRIVDGLYKTPSPIRAHQTSAKQLQEGDGIRADGRGLAGYRTYQTHNGIREYRPVAPGTPVRQFGPAYVPYAPTSEIQPYRPANIGEQVKQTGPAYVPVTGSH